MLKRKYKYIGETLVFKEYISDRDLQDALEAQEKCGAKLGKILIGAGKIGAYNFHRELAEHLEMDFVNLQEDECDHILLETEERQTYLELGVIPCKKAGKNIILATSDLTEDVKQWAEQKYKQYSFCLTSPFDIAWSVQKFFAANDDEDARDALWNKDKTCSAKELFSISKPQAFLLLAALATLTVIFLKSAAITFFIAINAFYALTLSCKLLFFITGHIADRKNPPESERPPDANLPIYTFLIPLYKEKPDTIVNLLNSINNMDYPKSKLDVKLIVEADDALTIDTIKCLQPENYIEILPVPYSLPRTKPKACNYALKFARGEYVTIYDAEDRPDPQQLRKVLGIFAESRSDVVCVQARLNYYNRKENMLTRLFAIEYSSWFNYMLPGLQALGIPIPLGGTSNHFPTHVLRDLNGWDPYNVTEDADLGVRLAQYGYKTAIVDSTTLEEAPIGVRSWLRQRSRWIKGYMQTYIVHMRQPLKLLKTLGLKGFLGFLFFIGAPSLVFLTMPIVFALSMLAYMSELIFPDWLLFMALGNLVGGVVLHVIIAMVITVRHKWWDMLVYSLLFPYYWVLHSIASFRALWQLFTKPHFWEKTEHGLSRMLPRITKH